MKDINPETATLDDLKLIPVMTKKDVMENWDEIICDSAVIKKNSGKTPGRDIWGIGITNFYGNIEMGTFAVEEKADNRKMRIVECFNIIETVNVQDHDSLVENARIIATNMYNYTFPMVRYKVDDLLTVENPDKIGSRFILSVDGRSDVTFSYGNIKINPMLFRHVLGQHKNIEEYQVIQTEQGATIYVIGSGDIKVGPIIGSLAPLLNKAGLNNPMLNIIQKNNLPKHSETGKFKRFVPLK